MSARIEGDTVIVMMPAHMTAKQEQLWVDTMLTRLEASEARRRPSDDELLRRARELAAKYLTPAVRIGSVQWSDQQGRRWGSCTVDSADIRISTRLRGMPRWVVDYVIVHELAHTVFKGHHDQFWALVDLYPHTARARGFLEGVDYASRHTDDASDTSDTDDASDTSDTDDVTNADGTSSSGTEQTDAFDSAAAKSSAAEHADMKDVPASDY